MSETSSEKLTASCIRYYPNGTSAQAVNLELDVLVSEEITFESEVTQHPVEVGPDVSDHIIPKLHGVRIEAVVANTPLRGGEGAWAFHDKAHPPRLESLDEESTSRPGDDARRVLEQITSNGYVCDVFLGTQQTGRVYEKYAMISASFPRDARTGDALRFNATFKEIRFVSNASTSAPSTSGDKQGTKDQGMQPTKPAAGADDEYATTFANDNFPSPSF